MEKHPMSYFILHFSPPSNHITPNFIFTNFSGAETFNTSIFPCFPQLSLILFISSLLCFYQL